MATLDRTVLETWSVNDASDMFHAIEEAQELVEAEGEDAYLSFILNMAEKGSNVDRVKLIKVDLTDSFAYELELS